MNAVLSLTILLAVPGQCGPSGCRPVAAPAAARHEWVRLDDTQWSLRRDGVQLGVYVVKEDRYYRKTGPGQFEGQPSAPPVPVPESARSQPPAREVAPSSDAVRTVQGDVVPTGVQWDRVKDGAESDGEHFHGPGGARLSRDAAMAAIRDVKIPDWKGKLRVSIFGKDRAEAEAVAREVSALRNISRRSIITDYDLSSNREAWVAEPGFKTSPTPQIVVQDGPKVLERFEGPGAVAALRKADPKYDPAKDIKIDGVDLTNLNPGCVLGALALLLALSKKREEK